MCAPAPSKTARSTGLSHRHSALLHVPGSPGIAASHITDQHKLLQNLSQGTPNKDPKNPQVH
jgi:hypothetical protein